MLKFNFRIAFLFSFVLYSISNGSALVGLSNKNGMCISIPNDENSATTVSVAPCDAKSLQQRQLEVPSSSGPIKAFGSKITKCLDATSDTVYSSIALNACNNANSQIWTRKNSKDTKFASAAGLCIFADSNNKLKLYNENADYDTDKPQMIWNPVQDTDGQIIVFMVLSDALTLSIPPVGAVITTVVCWNNKLYTAGFDYSQCSKANTLHMALASYTAVCGNQRAIHVTKSEYETDYATVSKIGVKLSSATQYTITSTVKLTNAVPSYIIEFPDGYLSKCLGDPPSPSPCAVTAYDANTVKEYKITINGCASVPMASGTAKLAVIIRGTKGNLNRAVLTGNTFNGVVAGQGSVGTIMDVTIEHDSGPDFCIGEVQVNNPFPAVGNSQYVFKQKHLGDGVFVSSNCNKLYFKHSTDIHRIRCIDNKGFTLKAYQNGTYASVQIKTCAGTDAGMVAANSGSLSMTVTGLTKSARFESFGPFSMVSTDEWTAGTSRDYTFAIEEDLKKVSTVSISNTHSSDSLCIDSVLINGKSAFLTNYWVGPSSNHGGLSVIPAVLDWPICKVEYRTTIQSEAPPVLKQETMATASCVNKNRLIATECSIEQTFETYEEVMWSNDIGVEKSESFSMARGSETSVTTSLGFGASFGMEIGGDLSPVSVSMGFSVSMSEDNTRTYSSESTQEKGVTRINTTTNGKVNGKTTAIQCGGSVTVPASNQVKYSLIVAKGIAKISTVTDITMTKCSKYLFGATKKENDASDYVVINGIKGELKVKHATNCYVVFEQATQVNPGVSDWNCGKERALAARAWGTFVPMCDATDSKKYSKCQCDHSDSRTKPTCACVDDSTGNILDATKAAVVNDGKWENWCNVNCKTSLTAGANAADVVPNVPNLVNVVDYNGFGEFHREMNAFLSVIAVCVPVLTVLYAYSLCGKKWNSGAHAAQYQFVKESEEEQV